MNSENIIKKYVNEAIIRKEYHVIDKHFSEDILYYSEFGYAVGGSGVKVHLESWYKLFELLDFKINGIETTDSGATLYFIESIKHIGLFKTIPPTGNAIKCNGIISFGFNNNYITTYVMQRNISDIVQQLVNQDEIQYYDITNAPILPFPYKIHLKSLLQYFRIKDIMITLEQLEYLCAWRILRSDQLLMETLNLSRQSIHKCQSVLKLAFNCSSDDELFKKINIPYVERLMDESYHLLMSYKHKSKINPEHITH